MSGFITEERGNIVINTVPSGTTLGEILAFAADRLEDWATREVIYEVSAADFSSLDSPTLADFVARSAEGSRVRSGRKTAIVAAGDLNFGMMRMFAMLAGDQFHIELSVFRDIAGALAWLEERE